MCQHPLREKDSEKLAYMVDLVKKQLLGKQNNLKRLQ